MSWAFCTTCHQMFSSDSGFDRHRTGTHDYSFREGLDLPEPREDGRRCLDEDEMVALGMTQDSRGWWRLPTKGRTPASVFQGTGSTERPRERSDDP